MEEFPEVGEGLNFTLDLRVLPGVQKVAPASVAAVSVPEVCDALLRFVLGVGGVVFAEFVGAVGELALVVVGAVAELGELAAEL